jgi:murein DD-endopeptidase MepM/ murein hydrolase activator NlpD
MRALFRFLLFLILLAGIVAAGAWFWAGRLPGPAVDIRQPGKFVGQASPLDVKLTTPGGRLSRVDVTVEQGGKTFPVFALSATDRSSVKQDAADTLSVMREIGKQAIPQLQQGAARIVVRAARPVLYGYRQAESVATKDVQVRLDPPRVEVRSTFHFVNHGGSEFVVYRATPPDVESGVRVGDQTYAGFPASGAGIQGDDSMRVAFFALLYDQDLNTPIEVYARDPAGNQVVAALDHRVFPKPFGRSRIVIDDKFLQHVVPQVAAANPDMKLSTAPQDMVESFLRINGDLRRRNGEMLMALAKKTTPLMLWKTAFQPLGNAAVEAKFADYRTYFYNGKEIDRQVHLGFDLAVTTHIPVTAAQDGIILHASDLGIFGNCVVLDHGLGVQSLYGHLSSIDVKVGQKVQKGQMLGRSGMTGIAGGDHLHFTMLVDGRPVNPVEWWDPKWMQDRVLRKIMEAGGVG